jgi:hypothetical protein
MIQTAPPGIPPPATAVPSTSDQPVTASSSRLLSKIKFVSLPLWSHSVSHSIKPKHPRKSRPVILFAYLTGASHPLARAQMLYDQSHE